VAVEDRDPVAGHPDDALRAGVAPAEALVQARADSADERAGAAFVCFGAG
jgi:hypothetical protein